MRLSKAIVVAGIAALALTACGSTVKEGDSISEYTFVYNGHPLHCVRTGLGNTATMSCDWVRYHNENG